MKYSLSRAWVKFLSVFFCGLLFAACSQDRTRELKQLDYPESFETMVSGFTGHLVYLEVMASWCKPCQQELPYYVELDDFFTENGIVKIFISIDVREDLEVCFNMIKEKGIDDGYFVSYLPPAGMSGESSFAKDVEPFFIKLDSDGNMQGMSVPQYLIIDKKGKIVEYQAKRPSDFEGLKTQLASYL